MELIISYPGPLTTHLADQGRNLGTPSLPFFPLTYSPLQNHFNSTMLHLPSRFTAMTSVQASFMSYLLYGNNLPAGPPTQAPLSFSSLVSSLQPRSLQNKEWPCHSPAFKPSPARHELHQMPSGPCFSLMLYLQSISSSPAYFGLFMLHERFSKHDSRTHGVPKALSRGLRSKLFS